MTSQGSRFPKNIFSKQFYGRLRKLKKFIDFTKGIFTPGRTVYVYDCRYPEGVQKVTGSVVKPKRLFLRIEFNPCNDPNESLKVSHLIIANSSHRRG